MKSYHFQGVSNALQLTFQIPALFKEFKDLHKLLKDGASSPNLGQQFPEVRFWIAKFHHQFISKYQDVYILHEIRQFEGKLQDT